MPANDRGYESDEIEVNFVAYLDTDQNFHSQEELEGGTVDDVQWDAVDWATVEVRYPDGHREFVHFVGPFEDVDDFYEGFLDWIETGRTP